MSDQFVVWAVVSAGFVIVDAILLAGTYRYSRQQRGK